MNDTTRTEVRRLLLAAAELLAANCPKHTEADSLAVLTRKYSDALALDKIFDAADCLKK